MKSRLILSLVALLSCISMTAQQAMPFKYGKPLPAGVRKLYADAFGFNGSVDESTQKLISLFESLGVPMHYEGSITREAVDAIPRRTELSKDEVYTLISELVK